MPFSSDSDQSGYSLFEVLVAFMIMSTILAVLVPGQALIMNRTATSNKTITAIDLALSQMSLLRAGPIPRPGENTHQNGAYNVTHKVEMGRRSDSTNYMNLLVIVEDLDQDELFRINGIRTLAE